MREARKRVLAAEAGKLLGTFSSQLTEIKLRTA